MFHPIFSVSGIANNIAHSKDWTIPEERIKAVYVQAYRNHPICWRVALVDWEQTEEMYCFYNRIHYPFKRLPEQVRRFCRSHPPKPCEIGIGKGADWTHLAFE
jgi:hypothetical protein